MCYNYHAVRYAISIVGGFFMKYEAPICEILKFGEEDILTTSSVETSRVQWGSSLGDLDLDINLGN